MSDAVGKAVFRDALQPGTVIHGYTIRAVLGRGGFGTTYHATDQLDQSFAIKEYFPRQFATRHGLEVVASSEPDQENLADCRQRFLFEAKTLCQLGKTAADDGIVKVLTFFEANGTAYIVMEFLSGDTLEDVLKRTPGGLPGEHLQTILRRILSSLARVHGADLVHRDIKPANIFIRRDGRPVLIDFGSAREASRNQNTTYTQIFSAGYAPIEQISGTRQGAFSDIYAVGAVCYRAIGGTLVDAITRQQARLRGGPDPLVPARQLGLDRYPMGLLRTIDRALSVNPEDRPQTVQELLAGLDDAAGADDATVVSVGTRHGPHRSSGSEAGDAEPRLAQPHVFKRWKAASIAAGIVAAAALVIGTAVFVPFRPERGEAEAWAELVANPSDDGYQSYLDHFPNGAHQPEAQLRLTALADAKAWTEVSTAPSDGGYRAYLGRFPEGAHKQEAQVRLDGIAEAGAWAEISAKPSDAAYQTYLDRFPQGAHRAEATARLGELAEARLWTEVSARRSEAAYQSYLERFPEGPHRGDAAAHLTAIAEWRKLRDTGSGDDLAAFLARHPNEPFAEEARQKLAAQRRAEADAGWDRIKGTEDQKVLQGYLDKYPASPHGNDAKQRLAILRGRDAAAAWARVKDSQDPGVVQAYLNDYPGGPFEPLAKARLAEMKRRAESRGSSAAQGKP
jgi:hypothetical protein